MIKQLTYKIWPLILALLILTLDLADKLAARALHKPLFVASCSIIVFIVLSAIYRLAAFLLRLGRGTRKISDINNETTISYILSMAAALVFLGLWAGTTPLSNTSKAFFALFNRISTHKEQQAEFHSPWYPLVLDMNRDGAAPASEKNTFNMKGGEFSNATSWIGKGDSFLAIDRNNNGKIDEGQEIVGLGTPLISLAQLDDNDDGIIDDKDLSFSKILAWAGRSSPTQPPIINLSKDMRASAIVKTPSGYVLKTPAGEYPLIVAELMADNVNTTYSGQYTLEPQALFLPELRGYGAIPDLSIGISKDAELLKSLQEIAAIPVDRVFLDFKGYLEKLDRLLYMRAGVQAVDPHSRGPDIDARRLGYVEKTLNEQFKGIDGRPDPLPAAAAILRQIYETNEAASLRRLLIQTDGATLFSDPIVYDSFKDILSFTGEETYPALSIDGIRKLGEQARSAENKPAYWASAAFFISLIRGSLEEMSPQETAALEEAIKAGDPGLHWDKIKAEHLALLPCNPCFYGVGATLAKDPIQRSGFTPRANTSGFAEPEHVSFSQREEAAETALEASLAELSPAGKESLRKTQQSWKRFVEDSCDPKAPDWRYKTVDDCRSGHYARRAKELNHMVVKASGGLVIRREEYMAVHTVHVSEGTPPQRISYRTETKYMWPQIDNPATAAQIQWNELMTPKIPENEKNRDHYCNSSSNYKLGLMSSGFISVELNEGTYCNGTPHRIGRRRIVNAVLSANRNVAAPDVFKRGSGWEDALVKLSLSRLERQGKDKADYSGLKKLAVKPETWGFFNDGLHINYGFISGYAQAEYIVRIPWNDLRPYLVEDSAVAAAINSATPPDF